MFNATILGTNSEQGYIGGAICAERAALVRLRQYDKPVIVKVVIVTDSVQPVAPGVLCREFLLSHASPDTDVVLGGCDGEVINCCKLGQLYPFPYVYRYLQRDEILDFASKHSTSIKCSEECHCNPDIHRLHSLAMEAIKYDDATTLHPLQFAAAVMYMNGDIEVTWMLKALEYGNTLDPVSQLVVGMERRRVGQFSSDSTGDNGRTCASSATPKYIIMTDQFGVCHAPFAMARSILSEHNYGSVEVAVEHSVSDGGYKTIPALELAPPSPSGDLPLTREDFVHICCR